MTPREDILRTVTNQQFTRWYQEDSRYWSSDVFVKYSNLWLEGLAWIDWE